MKPSKDLSWLFFAAGILSLLCLVVFWMALHDIYHDYASPEVIRNHTSVDPGSLPSWTQCPMEWKWAGICFIPVLLFQGICLVRMFPTARGHSPVPGLPEVPPALN